MSNETKQKNEKEKLSQNNKDLDNVTFVEDESRDVQRVDSSRLLIKNARYEIIENYREAVDLETLKKRYSNIFEKYDYIVGDISRDQLRLRGFYENDNDRVPVDMKIFSLEDYLAEYCNFGCQYFVLKRLDPKKNFKPYKKNKKSSRSKKPSYKKSSKKNDKRPKKRPSKNKSGSGKSKKERNKKSDQKSNNKQSGNQQKKSKQNFVKKERRKDAEKKTKESKSKERKTVTDQNERFQIRKNKQE